MTTERIRSAVRQNAVSAAIAAACMLYFGFRAFAEPTGASLFERSNWILFHTLRIGGIAMALVAIGSWLGYRPVLMVDAVVSTVVGLLFIVSGGGMLIDGGAAIQNALVILFGLMFVSAGVRTARRHAWLNRARDA